MLNHKFYKYDENFKIDSVQEKDFIRISNRLIEDLKSCLSKHKFTEYNSEKKIYGLSGIDALLNREDILYLHNCLVLKGSDSPEYVKFQSFLENCLSNGKQVLHIDGSPLQEVLFMTLFYAKKYQKVSIQESIKASALKFKINLLKKIMTFSRM